MTARDRRLGLAVFALLFFSYAYFYQGGGWNENSRFDLVRAIVEDGSLSIDRYHANTGDKALFRGHYYSDKAPGLSFVAAPLYALIRVFSGLFATEHDFIVFATYSCTLFTVGLSGALLGALVYRAARRAGATPAGSVIGAVGYGLGTAAFPLSTMFFSHQVSALLLFSAFLLSWEKAASGDPRPSLAVVLPAAAAVLFEFPTAPAALAIVLVHLRLRRPKRLGLLVAAALLPIAALGTYLAVAFGSPARIGYDLLADPASRAEMHSHGLFGVTYPKLGVVVELLFGRYRGLFPYSPLQLLAVSGFLSGLFGGEESAGSAEPERRRALWLALAVVVYFVLFVSSYAWWEGGASFGSRHLAPMLPFLGPAVALVASRRPGVATVLLVASVLVMLVVTSVQSKPSDWIKDPFWAHLLPAFEHGKLALTRACPVYGSPTNPLHHPFASRAPFDSFNLGMLLGGRGLTSLVPLLAGWAATAFAIGKDVARPEE